MRSGVRTLFSTAWSEPSWAHSRISITSKCGGSLASYSEKDTRNPAKKTPEIAAASLLPAPCFAGTGSFSSGVAVANNLANEQHDIIWGAAAIAALLNLTTAQVFHMLSRGVLPAKKMGGRWCASKRRLLAAVGAEGACERDAPLPLAAE